MSSTLTTSAITQYRDARAAQSAKVREFVADVKRQRPGTYYYVTRSAGAQKGGVMAEERAFGYYWSRAAFEEIGLALRRMGVNVAFQLQAPSTPDARLVAAAIPDVDQQVLGVPAHLKRAEAALAAFDAETARVASQMTTDSMRITATPPPGPVSSPLVFVGFAAVAGLVAVLVRRRRRAEG